MAKISKNKEINQASTELVNILSSIFDDSNTSAPKEKNKITEEIETEIEKNGIHKIL